jgi:alkylation response protein AidB-like acyl-CoA dehydrogenase
VAQTLRQTGVVSNLADLPNDLRDVAADWRADRAERMRRRHLEQADFDALRDAGFLKAAVPVDQGGSWESIATSTRPLASALRALASGDPSVALVAAMHPAVVGYWLATDAPDQPAWVEQQRAVYAAAASGSQWGTITSEPGSGGDILKTRTLAEPTSTEHPDIPGRVHLLTGDKHFGSGFGISDYMFTTGLVPGDDAPSAFVIDMRSFRDGASSEVQITAEWDGAGMIATQSHGARLEAVPAVRMAYEGSIETLMLNAGPFVMTLFTAVVLGVLDEAVALARDQLASKRESLRAFEQVEWSRAEMEHWLAEQALEGALRAVETGDGFASLRAALRAKTSVAELSEASVRRISRVLGGGTFARRSPISSWFEDVRALGFLRPPWGLAYDNLFATSFD